MAITIARCTICNKRINPSQGFYCDGCYKGEPVPKQGIMAEPVPGRDPFGRYANEDWEHDLGAHDMEEFS